MIGVMVAGPPEEIGVLVAFADGLEGYRGMTVVDEVQKILWFEDQESAINAQWLLELSGAKPIEREGEEDERTDEILPAGPEGHDG